tara:strand:+ start:69 stop:710 length:642 start_codon:yes stop_codon:yes gene_type:complete
MKNFRIYVVHFEELKERKLILEESLKKSGISYYFETKFNRNNLTNFDLSKFTDDIQDSYKANFLSHIKCYEIISKSKEELGLILEDDSSPGDFFYDNINDYLTKLPKDFGLFFISAGKNNFHIPWYLKIPFKKVYKKNNRKSSWGGNGASRNADAYFISKKYAKLIYEEFTQPEFITDTSIDWWMNEIIRKYEIPVYWAEPVLIETNQFESSF